MSCTTCPKCGSQDILIIEAWDCEEVGPHYWHHHLYEYIDCLACGRKSPVKGETNARETGSHQD